MPCLPTLPSYPTNQPVPRSTPPRPSIRQPALNWRQSAHQSSSSMLPASANLLLDLFQALGRLLAWQSLDLGFSRRDCARGFWSVGSLVTDYLLSLTGNLGPKAAGWRQRGPAWPANCPLLIFPGLIGIDGPYWWDGSAQSHSRNDPGPGAHSVGEWMAFIHPQGRDSQPGRSLGMRFIPRYAASGVACCGGATVAIDAQAPQDCYREMHRTQVRTPEQNSIAPPYSVYPLSRRPWKHFCLSSLI